MFQINCLVDFKGHREIREWREPVRWSLNGELSQDQICGVSDCWGCSETYTFREGRIQPKAQLGLCFLPLTLNL